MVIYEVSNPLAFEEFWPSHLSFVFISVVLVTHCPHKPWNGSVGLVANEWKVVSPFLWRETKLWMRNQERMGKWVTVLCHCDVHFIIPHMARAALIVQRRKEAFLQRLSFSFDFIIVENTVPSYEKSKCHILGGWMRGLMFLPIRVQRLLSTNSLYNPFWDAEALFFPSLISLSPRSCCFP